MTGLRTLSGAALAMLLLGAAAASTDEPGPAERDDAIAPAAVAAREQTTILIDIRDSAEYRAGHVPGAINVPRAWLEFDLEDVEGLRGLSREDRLQQPIVLYCARGYRSAAAADALRQGGYANVRIIAGGFDAWQAEGLPVVESDSQD